MKEIELVPGIKSSVLGFGCAPVMGAVGSGKAKKAITAALAAGINHFDLARSYGYGEAEQFVGSILKNRRNQVVIASKFGIKANNKAKLLKPFKPLVRQLAALKGKAVKSGFTTEARPTDQRANQIADRFHYRIDINRNEMNKSLEESLRSLKTDHIDYFFIHEPDGVIEEIDEVIGFAEKLKQQGKIRAFGLAYMQSQLTMHAAYLDRFDLLQTNNSVGAPGYNNLLDTRKIKPNIFFSTLKGGASNLSANEKLQKLHADFPRSVLLCSMFNEKHIEQNAAIFE